MKWSNVNDTKVSTMTTNLFDFVVKNHVKISISILEMFVAKVRNTELQRTIYRSKKIRQHPFIQEFLLFSAFFSFKKRLPKLYNVYLVNSELETKYFKAI